MNQMRLLAVSSIENSKRIETILQNEKINLMAVIQPDSGNIERAAAMPVDAVVIMSAALSDEEQYFMERLYMTRDKLAFILICEAGDTRILTRAMGCGITKVLTLDMEPSEICDGIEDEVSRVQMRTETAGIRQFDSRVLSVFSTKGGTGKTTVAVNLAYALQKLDKRVAIVDLDLQFGDVSVFLNIPAVDTISDLAGEQLLSPSVVNSYLFKHESGLKVMCAPESPELAELVKTETLEKVLTVLQAEFDFVVCDLAPVLDDVSLFALERSEMILFVTNPEIPTLKNTHTCISVLSTLGFTEKIKVLLNRSGDKLVSVADVERALDCPLEAVIPADIKASSSAINRGIPVVECFPRSKMSRSVVALAKTIIGGEPEKKGSSLFRRKKSDDNNADKEA